MKRFVSSLWIALLVLMCGLPLAAQDPFALKADDTVVFYGDSITDQRLYTMLTELFVVTRYPKLDVTFVDSGWGGDKVSGGGGGPIDTRLTRDVVAYHPTVMTIMLGMNDGEYTNHTEASDTAYYAGYHHIIDSMQKLLPGLRISMIGPSPYDDVTRPINLQPDGYNAIMVRYSDYLKKYANEAKLGYADLNTGVVDMLKKANATDPAAAQKIIPDRVHPALAGHLIMAEQLLRSWNARPVVSTVSIDASNGKVSQSEFANITQLHTGSPLSWSETEEALPLPFAEMIKSNGDRTMALAIQSSDVTEILNQEPLIVTGLAAGRYNLSVDGETVGTYSDGELAQGVNLATLDTPMARQSAKVQALTIDRLNVHQQRWRALQVPLTGLDLLHLDEAVKSLDTLDAELAKKQHEAAQPMPHMFQVSLAQ
jgi:lysophospholipase L1-like esterase